jgi:hypothetical protein
MRGCGINHGGATIVDGDCHCRLPPPPPTTNAAASLSSRLKNLEIESF